MGGEAQEDEAEDGRGVFLGFEAGIRAELVGSVPEAFFECSIAGVFFGWGDLDHEGSVVREVLKNGFVPGHVTCADGISNRSTSNSNVRRKRRLGEIETARGFAAYLRLLGLESPIMSSRDGNQGMRSARRPKKRWLGWLV